MPENDDFTKAADQAYRLASRWGGEYAVILLTASGIHIVRGSDGIASIKDPHVEIGRVISNSIEQLEWKWTDGRMASPPVSPFERCGLTGEPYWSMRNLDPESRKLMELMTQVMAVQRAFLAGRVGHATQILASDPAKIEDCVTVPYPGYLANAQNHGQVESEVARLEWTLRHARAAVADNTMRGAPQAEDIIFGRVRLPASEDESGAAPAP